MLNQFFNPKSIALVGASREPGKLGYKILQNLIDGGYTGKLYPVNPKSSEILGLKSYPDVSGLPEAPELVIVVIPSSAVCAVAEECGKKGTKGMIVISAGFKEMNADGKKKEEDLVAIVRKYGMRLIGPNCLGVIDCINNVNSSFAFEIPLKGNIAFLSQSGALGTAVLDWAMAEGVGLSKFISVGNMADVSEGDLIEALGDDPDTKVILVYLEGIKNGRKFIEIARKVSRKKPVIVVKSGVTSSGLKAVSSHTGSLAGSDRAFQAAFSQCGVLRAKSVQELFDYALVFSFQPMLKGERLAIVTNAGGPSVMAVDAIEERGLTLAPIAEGTSQALKGFLPAAANTKNPVDVLGDALAVTYGKAMDCVMKDPAVDGVIAILTPQVITQMKETAEEVIRSAQAFGKPVVTCFMGGKRISESYGPLKAAGIPNYPFPERAVSALNGMTRYRRWCEKPEGKYPSFSVDVAAAKAVFAAARSEGRTTIGDIEGRKVLAAYGIPTIQSFLAATKRDVAACAGKVGFPLVMKLVSPDILHKTEAGGVKVGIGTIQEAEQAFDEIIVAAKRYKKDAVITGVQLQTRLGRATEVIIGISKDPQFGQLLMFGLGGVFVEVLKDVAFRVIPVSDIEIEEMIAEIKGKKILEGFRNIPPADMVSVKDVLARISKLCSDFPEIAEMDINPLMVLEKGAGAMAVDVRFAIEK